MRIGSVFGFAFLRVAALVLLEDREVFTRGGPAIAESLTQLYGRSHRVTPVAWGVAGAAGHIAG